MKHLHPLLAALLTLPALNVAAHTEMDAEGLLEARDFLEGYRTLNAGDEKFFNLYSDEATLHVNLLGQDHGFVLRGRAYKAWGRENLKSGHLILDASIFRGASVERRGKRLVIHARRYSTTRCYWDEGYRVVIEKQGSEERILDEVVTLNPASHCDPTAVEADTNRFGLTSASSSWNSPSRPNAAATAAWHPLSQEEIAAMALKLAREAAATPTASVPTAAPSGNTSPPIQKASQTIHSDVRVDPSDGDE